MNPVPHISARSIKNFDELDSFVKQLSQTSNVSEVLVISGSSNSPIGEFHETMQILNSGILPKYNIKILFYQIFKNIRMYYSNFGIIEFCVNRRICNI